jgi:hypothetical protein
MNEKQKAEVTNGMFAGATFVDSVVVGVAEAGSEVFYNKEIVAKEEPKITLPIVMDSEEASHQEDNDDDLGSDVVSKCFIFTSDFVKEKVEALVMKYYKGSHADLALIEIALFDHGQLRKRNSHKAFARSLAVWGIMKIASDEDLKSIVDCIKDKYSRIPKDGYKEWGEIYLNEKNTCINIGHEIEDTMPYIRKKEE